MEGSGRPVMPPSGDMVSVVIRIEVGLFDTAVVIR